MTTYNENNWMFYSNCKWKLKFAWFPKRCDISNRLIWLETGYKGVFTWKQLVDMGMNKITLSETRWITKTEFIIGKLKGTI